MQYLYSVEFEADSPSRQERFWACTRCSSAAREYGRGLVGGVLAQLNRIDAAIEARLTNWTFQRLTFVDRNILRIAVYELLFTDAVPERVVINEAIEIAKKFGSEKSSSFINGILNQFLPRGPILRDHE